MEPFVPIGHSVVMRANRGGDPSPPFLHPPPPTKSASTGAAGDAAHAYPEPEPPREPHPLDVWQERITAPGFKDLEMNEVRDEYAQAVAGLCLEHAHAHADTVRRVLSLNGNVRTHAAELLKADASRSPDQQARLALCVLDAGYPISLPGEGLALAVVRVVEERDLMEERLWDATKSRFDEVQKNAPPDPPGIPPLYQGKGLPYFDPDPKYSREDLNFRIGPGGKNTDGRDINNLVCKQLQKATDGTLRAADGHLMPKEEVLALPLEVNASLLDRAALTRADEEELLRTFGINYPHRQFGEVVRELCRDLPIDQERSFRVGWRGKDAGHVMRVFLTRLPDGFIRIGQYEPGVTRNIAQEHVLPERLAYVQWDQFDVLKKRARYGAEVLNIRVPDKKLAEACAGKFVPPDTAGRVAMLSQAVGFGDYVLAERLMTELRNAPPTDFTEREIKELENALTWAMGNNDAVAGVKLFMSGLKELRLSSSQLSEIALARSHEEVMGFAMVLQEGRDDVAKAYIDGLKGLQLDPEHLVHVLMPKDGPPLLACLPVNYSPANEYARTVPHLVEPFLSMLEGLNAEQLEQIVNAKDGGFNFVESMVASHNRHAMACFFRGLDRCQLHTDLIGRLVAPGLLMAMRNGDGDIFGDLLQRLELREVPLWSVVKHSIVPRLRTLMDTADPKVLNLLSYTITLVAPNLSKKEKRELLDALHHAQGEPHPWHEGGMRNSDATKKLKKDYAYAYSRFQDAKTLLKK
jgi:hypothetical protein